MTQDDTAGQAKGILAKIDDLLAKAGTDKKSLLTAQIWLKEIDRDFVAMNEVWNAWLDPENKPVRATVQANMAKPNILVEIQVTAAASCSPSGDDGQAK
mmetsp:Transcript_19741/g.37425  ORF Transcript_19741/g.37425 Transcript_19741/m.37425 type:complete len:99 (+) Transcript_19741:304-600(+)